VGNGNIVAWLAETESERIFNHDRPLGSIRVAAIAIGNFSQLETKFFFGAFGDTAGGIRATEF